jgi:hypothetical protein
MISGFLNLQSFNDGTTKKVSVFAQEAGNGGLETIQFQVIDQALSVQVSFAANQGQMVSVVHTASGKGLVVVTAANSPQTTQKMLNVDKQPSDDGSQ